MLLVRVAVYLPQLFRRIRRDVRRARGVERLRGSGNTIRGEDEEEASGKQENHLRPLA